MWRGFCIFVLSTLVFNFSLSLALAEGFNLTDYSARGTALGGAMVGRANDASAVAYNPAGITQLPGVHFMIGSTLISPVGKVKTWQNGVERTTDVDKKHWVNPHFYYTHQISDKVFLGVGLFSRFGLGNSYPDNWPGNINLQSVSLKTFSFNPNLAVKVTDKLSLAAGVEFMYATMEMERRMPPSGQQADFSGHSIAPAFNLALHYKFNEQWAAGLTYRSNVEQKVGGHVSFSDTAFPLKYRNSDLDGKLKLPDQVTMGLAYTPTPPLSIEIGAVYTAWSRYNDFNINIQNQPVRIMNQLYADKKWKDTWAINLGVEYEALDWLTLRAGYVYETSPMNKDTMDYMTPSDGRHRFSVGAGFKHENWTVDLAYSYLWIKGISYNDSATQTIGVLPGSGMDGQGNIFSVSVGYRF